MKTEDKRIAAKEYITLTSSQDGAGAEYIFNILAESGRGASAIVYDAYCEELGRGVLKEFYPAALAESFDRDTGGQLSVTGSEGTVRAETELYLRPYRLLAEHKRSSVTLSGFIPVTTVLYGIKDSRTVYIWNPEAMVKPFDDVCESFITGLRIAPHEKLAALLKVIGQLVACVSELHKCGLLHRDIKPENFGIRMRGGELLDQSVTMFDINSVCAAGDRSDVCHTAGYDAPEIHTKGRNTPLTDIYAIGAVLFHSLIITPETEKNGRKYDSSFYPKLKSMTDTSAFITACEDNARPRFRHMLTHILKKSLAPEPDKRYHSCAELKNDIDAALGFLDFDAAKEAAYAGEEKRRTKNSYLAFMYHLYKYPLYLRDKAEGLDDDGINVIITGFGSYGQKFLDAVLQLGQMYGKTLTVKVYNDDISDRDIYLADRPALTEFFLVDGACIADSYGSIFFDTSFHLDRHSPAPALCRLLQREENAACIFIALGDDDTNRRAAETAEKYAPSAHVCYACENDSSDEKAICVYRDTGSTDIRSDIERMAFANHLLWNRSPNIDRRALLREFMQPYNHDACIASVTAVKYRLYSMGIDLDTEGCERAAALYTKKLSRFYRNRLSMYEHRRWVTEKICNGWVCENDIRRAVRNGLIKNESERKHVCLIKSGNKEQKSPIWEEKDLSALDALDRISVTVHREYETLAEELKEDSSSFTSQLLAIRESTGGKALSAFNEWYACIKNIWEGDRQAHRLYSGLKAKFLSLVSGNARRLGEEFAEHFRPIYEAQTFKDYKREDDIIIDNTPYILTCSHSENIAVPLCTGSRAAELENTAALSLILPEKATYFCRAEDDVPLLRAVGFIKEYTERHNISCAVSFHILCSDAGRGEELKNKIALITGDSAAKISTGEELPEPGAFTAAMKNSSPLCGELENMGIYDRLPVFSYDLKACAFENIRGCERFLYISRRLCLAVEDTGFYAHGESPEFFDDHKLVYDIYSSSEDVWKRLCRRLCEHMAQSGIIGTLAKTDRGGKCSFILPVHCRSAVKNILRTLSASGFIGSNSFDSSLSMDSFRVDITDLFGNRDTFEKIFSAVYILPEAYAQAEKDRAYILYDDLICSGIPTDREEEKLLFKLSEMGYITGLRTVCGETSFTFASHKIKKLLTDENGAAMAYIYHSAVNRGCDDAAVSDDGRLCMITEGGKALFVSFGGTDMGDIYGDIISAEKYLKK